MPRKLSDYFESRPGNCLTEDEVKRVVEKTVAFFLTDLRDRINELAKELAALREEILSLREECRGKIRTVARKQSEKPPKGLSEKIRLIISERGFMLVSRLASRLRITPERLLQISSDLGYVLLDLQGDYAIIDPASFEEFRGLLSQISTPDPLEAARRMGRYSLLFEKLRSASLAFYDGRAKRWKIIK
jgi:hypothetical protein